MALPDLHTKMAKKVAQLTKVIFHLNTVNEDAQLEKDAMRAQHVREIDELSADAATKIEAIQAQLKDRKDQMNLEAKMTQMARKHQDEKSQAQAEFARYKREMLARDEAVVGEYQDKVGVLREEITVVKAQSQEAMRRFAESLDEMKKSRSNQAEDSAAEMRLLREKHQREVDDLVKTSNAKYHQMLAEQMTAQDLLREQMQEREEAVRAAAKAEFEQETGRLRAELRAEQQTTLLAQEKDFERKLKDCRDGLLGKLEKASSDKADLERELAALRQELEAARQGAAEVDRARDEAAASLVDARAEIARLREDIDGHLHSASSTEGEFESKLRDAHIRTQALEAQVTALEGERDQASRAVMQAGEEKRKMEATHAAFTQKMTQEMCSRDGQLAALNGQIDALKKRLSEQAASGSKESADLAATLKELEREKSALTTELAEARAIMEKLRLEAKAASSSFDEERRALEQKLVDAGKTWQQKLKENEDALERRITDAAQAADAALRKATDDHKAALASAIAQSKAREEDLEKGAAEAAALATQTMQTAAADHVRALQAAREQAARDLKDATKAREALERELAQLKEQSSGDYQKAQNEASRLAKEVGVLKTQLDKKETENKRWRTTCQELKTQVEDLRREIEDCKAAAKRHLEAELARVEGAWKTRLSSAASDAAAELEAYKNQGAQERALATEKFEMELAALRVSLDKAREAAVMALEQELAEVRTRAAEAAQEAERLHLADQAERNALSQESDDYIAKLRAENAEALARLEEDLRRQLKEQYDELTSNHAQEVERTVTAHEIHVQNMADEHSTALSTAHSDHQSAIESAELARREHVKQMEDDAAVEKAKALEDLRSDLSAERGAAIDALVAKFDAERDLLAQELTIVNSNLLEKSGHCVELEKNLSQRTEELRLANADKDAKLADAASREAAALEALRQAHARETEQTRAEYEADKHDLRTSMQQEYDILESDFLALQERWETRESRPEDLERIRQLEEEMVDKDKLVKKTMEEMVYFKRELLNREENFNKRFNQNVNVGVMQVIKPKDGKPNGKRPQGGKSYNQKKSTGPGPVLPAVGGNGSSKALGVGRM